MLDLELDGSEMDLKERPEWVQIRKVRDHSDVQVLRANLLRQKVHSSDPAYSRLSAIDVALAKGQSKHYIAKLLELFYTVNKIMSGIARGA